MQTTTTYGDSGIRLALQVRDGRSWRTVRTDVTPAQRDAMQRNVSRRIRFVPLSQV